MKLSASQLKAAVLGCTLANAEKYVSGLNAAMEKYGITTPLRAAHFLAQVGHESIGLSAAVESLNYPVQKLLDTFSRARISEADARKYGRIDGKQPANQEAIANLVYGGVWGVRNLGNSQAGDGWKFRGRGPLQTTGRANYKAAGKALGIDLEAHPEKINEPAYYAESAGIFWHQKELNALADLDRGRWDETDKATFIRIINRINGGTNGWEDREARFIHARAALGIPAPLTVPKPAHAPVV